MLVVFSSYDHCACVCACDCTIPDHTVHVLCSAYESGVMAARGILSNPCMYAGHSQTTLECVQRWVSGA